MQRRQWLQALGAALWGGVWTTRRGFAASAPRRKLLAFSRSVLFEHSVVQRQGSALSFAEKILVQLGAQLGWEIECTKEGSAFEQDLEPYDGFIAYSCGYPADLAKPESLDHSSPLTPEGRQRVLKAVEAGKGFIAIHPGILMLPEAVGADCIGHGTQQTATMRVTSPQFPGIRELGPAFALLEEWFSLRQFAKDLHVILVQDCQGMRLDDPLDKKCYDRPPFPATWCRRFGRGRVFYTSMGHREDVWTNKLFQEILTGGMRWALGEVETAIPANIEAVAPQAEQLPPLPSQ